jgi:subfamily B ATP-binding cassette protein HlyB/CyaB
MLARLHHLSADAAGLRHQLGKSAHEGVDTDDLLLAADRLGLKAKRLASTPERLPLVPLPALAHLRIGAADGPPVERWVMLAQCDGQRVLFQDPGAPGGGRPTIEPLATFAAQWTGELIVASSRASLAGELAKFDFSWFVPSLVKHRRLLGEVFLVSLFLQLFALVSPLFSRW